MRLRRNLRLRELIMAWGLDTFRGWISSAADYIGDALGALVDRAVDMYRGEVEADPTTALRRTQGFADVLWGADGLYERLDAYRAWTTTADPLELVDAQARAAAALGVSAAELDPNAFKRRIDDLAAPLLAESQANQAPAARVGIFGVDDVVIVGAVALTVSIVGMCWARASTASALTERERIETLARLGTSDDPQVLAARAQLLQAGGAAAPQPSVTSYVGPALAGLALLVGAAIAVPALTRRA